MSSNGLPECHSLPPAIDIRWRQMRQDGEWEEDDEHGHQPRNSAQVETIVSKTDKHSPSISGAVSRVDRRPSWLHVNIGPPRRGYHTRCRPFFPGHLPALWAPLPRLSPPLWAPSPPLWAPLSRLSLDFARHLPVSPPTLAATCPPPPPLWAPLACLAPHSGRHFHVSPPCTTPPIDRDAAVAGVGPYVRAHCLPLTRLRAPWPPSSSSLGCTSVRARAGPVPPALPTVLPLCGAGRPPPHCPRGLFPWRFSHLPPLHPSGVPLAVYTRPAGVAARQAAAGAAGRCSRRPLCPPAAPHPPPVAQGRCWRCRSPLSAGPLPPCCSPPPAWSTRPLLALPVGALGGTSARLLFSPPPL